MKNNVQIILATSSSIVITFTFHTVLNEKRASNSLFQYIIADTFHHSHLSLSCLINQRVNTSCALPLSTDDKMKMFILAHFPLVFIALIWYYGFKTLPGLLLGIFTILNVWLFARWCQSLHLWYPLDAFTIYLLLWQFSYLIFQWCYHRLSWPSIILYQGSICILSAIKAFIFYDLFSRYFPTIILALLWISSFNDIFQCLYYQGRFRHLDKHTSTNFLMPTYPGFPSFSYYTHDIEDGIDTIKTLQTLGGGDFVIYNLLLLWLLPPLSPIIIQLCVLFGFIINIQLGIIITDWIGSLWNEKLMPAVPVPVIIVSTYAIIIDLLEKV